MKLASCTIWILSALLVIATLDARPDPPAVNPGCQILQVHHYACATTPLLYSIFRTAHPVLVSSVTADSGEPYRPSDRIVLTGQAADPSPPPLQAARQS